MKLLMTTDTVGGVWTYTLELCAALGDHGVHIDLASMGRRLSPEQHRAVARLAHVRVHESEYRLCWMHDPWDDVERAGHWLLRLERQLGPDLVQLNDLGHGGLPWRSPVVLVGHSCVYSWWQAVNKQPPPPEDWHRYHRVVRASVQRADCLVAPSRAMLASLLHHYGPARAPVVIPNGRSYPPLADFAVTGHRPSPPTGLPMPRVAPSVTSDVRHNDAIIFTAGRVWDEAKNIATLVGVAGQLPWPVYVAGEQAQPGGDGDEADRCGTGARYLGYLDSRGMARWLRRAAIYVAPAHYEPFGLGILEAARAGCALVVGDIASLREIWADAAAYVNPDDPQQLRRVITQLAANRRHCRDLATRAWQRARLYSAARMASGYMQCYRALVRGGSEATPAISYVAGGGHRGLAGAKP